MARARLAAHAPHVEANADAFVHDLFERWMSVDEMAAALRDAASLARLRVHQRRYLNDLFSGTLDQDHVTSMLRTVLRTIACASLPSGTSPTVPTSSATHPDAVPIRRRRKRSGGRRHRPHRLGGWTPESCSARTKSSRRRAITRIENFEPEVRSAATRVRSAPLAEARRSTTVTQRPTTSADAQMRCAFLGIDSATHETLSRLSAPLDRAVPAMLDDFYAFLGRLEGSADLLTPEVIERLLGKVAQHWRESTTFRLDAMRGAGGDEIRVIHERLGFRREYLAGLARQLGHPVAEPLAERSRSRKRTWSPWSARRPSTPPSSSAYLHARAPDRHAGQGVRRPDPGGDGRRHRPRRPQPGAVRQRTTPSTSSRCLPGCSTGCPCATPCGSQCGRPDRRARQSDDDRRHVAVHRTSARTLRIVALKVPRSSDDVEPLIGILVDDVSDAVDAVDQLRRETNRLDDLLEAVGALVWEIDQDSLASADHLSCTAAITGNEATSFLGRPTPRRHDLRSRSPSFPEHGVRSIRLGPRPIWSIDCGTATVTCAGSGVHSSRLHERRGGDDQWRHGRDPRPQPHDHRSGSRLPGAARW
ncbi:MAG: protoglobin domain-containing protein [Ilumatobacteraceae bacterium]